jgi:uncharacterized protein (TIGR02757 family)
MGEQERLKDFFDQKVAQYNQLDFIAADPICIPHQFTRQQDVEIAGLFAALFAWGNRTIIINKSKELLRRMDGAPYDFVRHAQAADLLRLSGFVHRTFNERDIWFFMDFLRQHYQTHSSLEIAFSQWLGPEDETIEPALNGFKQYFFSLEHEKRTRKHISSPRQKSTCKRLNMYLRWMVRQDDRGVDFGLWKSIRPAQLVCPIDVHVARVARRFQLLQRKPLDWTAALDLTAHLRRMDPADPVKYDFALFGLGVVEKF